jgi:hypothetical protein
MKIEKHISELLFRYDRIIVPGLGLFTCSYESATVHPITHRFQPPNKRVAFDAGTTVDPDNTLTLYVAKVERMAAEEVEKGIADYISDLKNQIATKTGVEISKVGTLKNDDQGNLILKPDSETNVFAPAFGMSEFRSPAIERGKKPTKKKTVGAAPIVVAMADKKKEKGGFAFGRIAIILLLLIGTFALAYWKKQELHNVYVNIFNSSDSGQMDSSSIAQANPEMDNKNTGLTNEAYAPRTDASTISAGNFPGAEKLEDKVEGKDLLPKAFSGGKLKSTKKRNPARRYTAADIIVEYPDYYKEQVEYFLIAGCFVFMENAREFREKLLRKGYESQIVGPESEGCFRVAYAKYYLEEEALGRLNYIRATINDGAWLLKQ